MSRRSRRGARTGVGKASIDMNSLIDLTFLLLVTFILTIPALEQGITIMLPRAKTDLLPNKNRTPIGFQDILPAGEFDHTTLHDNSYSTPLNTTAVTSVHPGSVGLKLSLQINASRTDAQLAYDQERRNRKRKRPGPETPLEERPATVTVQQEQIVEDTIDAWAKHCEENKQLILYLSSECNIDLIELGGGNATSITDNREQRPTTKKVIHGIWAGNMV